MAGKHADLDDVLKLSSATIGKTHAHIADVRTAAIATQLAIFESHETLKRSDRANGWPAGSPLAVILP